MRRMIVGPKGGGRADQAAGPRAGALATGPTLDAGAPPFGGASADPLTTGTGGAAPVPVDRLMAGAAAGDYVVERFLGAGAMGEVYAGRHPVIGKRVAIKVLKRALSSSAEASERFTREARAVNQVDHPNVIDVFAFGRLADGRLYLVMELVEGSSLRAAVAGATLDVPTVLDVLAQIASALDAAHARGVIHRDLKPDNVMLDSGAPPKVFVLDFGLAKLATGGALATATLTEQGTWLGTPGYMAPEQWSADGASPASDRYAFGVLAFELLCGALPFTATTLPQMMEHHFRTPVPALAARGTRTVTGAFDPVLARAMAKDPDARFGSASACVDALRDAAGRATPRGRRARTGKPRPWLPALAGAGVLGLAVVAAVGTRGGRAESPRGASASADLDRAAGADDDVPLDVSTLPEGAHVYRATVDGDRLLGSTPLRFDLRAAETATLVVRKGGFRAERLNVTGRQGRRVVRLVPVNGFEGVWTLPDGQLRAYRRADDGHVDVSKLDAVAAAPTFYRRFVLEESQTGVVFTASEALSEGADPSCQIGFRVEYRFDPDAGTLHLVQEHLELSKRDGRCLVHARWPGTPVALQRVEQGSRDGIRTIAAPVGVPEVANAKPVRPVRPAKRAKQPPKGSLNQPGFGARGNSDKNLGNQANVPAPAVKPQAQQAVDPAPGL